MSKKYKYLYFLSNLEMSDRLIVSVIVFVTIEVLECLSKPLNLTGPIFEFCLELLFHCLPCFVSELFSEVLAFTHHILEVFEELVQFKSIVPVLGPKSAALLVLFCSLFFHFCNVICFLSRGRETRLFRVSCKKPDKL